MINVEALKIRRGVEDPVNGFTGFTGLDNHVNLVNPVEKDSSPLHLLPIT